MGHLGVLGAESIFNLLISHDINVLLDFVWDLKLK